MFWTLVYIQMKVRILKYFGSADRFLNSLYFNCSIVQDTLSNDLPTCCKILWVVVPIDTFLFLFFFK